MKRSRAILLFGLLLAMMAGYVAWCSRAFWLKVPLPDVTGMPEEARLRFLREIEASGMREPSDFEISLLWMYLVHPYDAKPVAIKVYQPSYGDIVAYRPGLYRQTGGEMYAVVVEFVERDGRWQSAQQP